MKKNTSYPKTQYEMNLERSAQLYPDGLRWSGMAAISNGGANYYHGPKHERPTKNTNDTK